jgi:nucleoside-diphosphate-sugar epimerase
MAETIVVAGATGNLGQRIVKSLLAQGAEVRALVRHGAGDNKVKTLQELGAKPVAVDLSNAEEISKAVGGAACVLSALQGLREVIVDTQSILLDGVIKAGVPRFIPSDFSTDFTKLPAGENRNFDLRREFHQQLDVAPIKSTSIFNGAFAEVLTYNVPLLDFKKRKVGYWGDADWLMDFTTMDNTAAYTAFAALDATTPRTLRIASFQVSPRELAQFTEEHLKTPFELVRMGSVEDLAKHNRQNRAAHPEGENELFASWQQSQYIQSMLSTHHESLDNGRYPEVSWTKLQDVIQARP